MMKSCLVIMYLATASNTPPLLYRCPVFLVNSIIARLNFAIKNVVAYTNLYQIPLKSKDKL